MMIFLQRKKRCRVIYFTHLVKRCNCYNYILKPHTVCSLSLSSHTLSNQCSHTPPSVCLLFFFLFFFFYKRRTRLVQLHVPQTGDFDILRRLGAQISVRRLDGFKHAGKLPSSFVVLRDVEDGTTLQRGNVLVVLLL